ncbi:zinc dependent phospholipase C family protein [Ferruginibacter paludis]|uniref:zinc dependent phospholipase C family protein n=1 Tax=Ferruginibacter paludis TaxID=1310417 RepID=UPI0025B291E9|nr:zinc dependent phospholipase C family protein [Ferruginibacter paludis]MDN3659069.1 zinc dependent phospholipase C family protein [Ferruginibacter paludis]
MKSIVLFVSLCCITSQCFCWGFYAHQKINYYAVFLLPPQMMVLYKPNISFISEHAVDPDKRRYIVADEGPRHFIDIDHYGAYPYTIIPRKWKAAIEKYGEDSLKEYGIVPWHIQTMLGRLTAAFKEKNFSRIMKNSAELGHYIADSHVPLHANSNHNGQYTNQRGIHGFWESRVPELLAENEFDFFIGKAAYISNPLEFAWARVLESAKAADSVLLFEKELTQQFGSDQKYAFENRNGVLVRQYSSAFTIAYNKKLDGMIERRMRQSIFAVASFWYTAWVNAGQPDLTALSKQQFSADDIKAFDELNNQWRSGSRMIGKQEE